MNSQTTFVQHKPGRPDETESFSESMVTPSDQSSAPIEPDKGTISALKVELAEMRVR